MKPLRLNPGDYLSRTSQFCCLASSGHQKVVLGIQWPLCSQKKGTGNPCLGVIRARGQLGGPLPITLSLEPACLGLLGQGKDQGPQIGFLWFQTLCRVVLWLVKGTPGCVPCTILNNDGIKVARSGGYLSSHEIQPGLLLRPLPLTQLTLHAQFSTQGISFSARQSLENSGSP